MFIFCLQVPLTPKVPTTVHVVLSTTITNPPLPLSKNLSLYAENGLFNFFFKSHFFDKFEKSIEKTNTNRDTIIIDHYTKSNLKKTKVSN